MKIKPINKHFVIAALTILFSLAVLPCSASRLNFLIDLTNITRVDVQHGDFFGYSAAVDGDVAVIGAPGDDDKGTNSGSAYIFKRNASGNWELLTKLTASDGAAWDSYGFSVAVAGDRIVIGAPLDNFRIQTGTGVLGIAIYDCCQICGLCADRGSVYIYDRNGTFLRKIENTDVKADDKFGWSVATDGATIVIGAPYDNFSCPGLGDTDKGTAYVYPPNSGSYIKHLYSCAVEDAGSFGYSAAVDGNSIVIGAPYDDAGDGANNGSVHFFEKTDGTWNSSAVSSFVAPDDTTKDHFGWSVSLHGNYAVIGAPGWDDGVEINQGRAYIYERDPSWLEIKKRSAPDGDIDDHFGSRVAVYEDTTGLLPVSEVVSLVGATGADGPSFEIIGIPIALVYDIGSAYLFGWDDFGLGTSNWEQHNQQFLPSVRNYGDHFGVVAVSRTPTSVDKIFAVIAAPDDNLKGTNSGSAYLYELVEYDDDHPTGDHVASAIDNCPDDWNPSQGDWDGDGIGDICDDDIDGDTFNNDVDNCPTIWNFFQEDGDNDNVGDWCDECNLVDHPLIAPNHWSSECRNCKDSDGDLFFVGCDRYDTINGPDCNDYDWHVTSPSRWYRDADDDGYGNSSVWTEACSPPTGYVDNTWDCDDDDPNNYPGNVEDCSDDKDNNCNGQVNEECNQTPIALCQDLTVSADGNCQGVGSINNGSYDPDGDPITLSLSPQGPYGLGTITVTLTVTDPGGASDTCMATVTVEDTTAPIIGTQASDLTVECDGAGNNADLYYWLTSHAGAQVSDNCGSVTWSHYFDYNGLLDGPGATGYATVTFTATDECGNNASTTATFTIVDATAPIFTAPPDVTAECAGPAGTSVDIGQPTASDTCCGEATVTNNAPAEFQLGDTVVTWTATDCNGNSSTAVQKVTVVDTTPPSITVPPGVTAECAGPDGTLVAIGQATGSDACCAEVTVTNNVPTAFQLGETFVTWTATDCNGNSSTAVQKVTVEDTKPPVLDVSLSPEILWPPNHKMVEIVPTIVASDICCANVNVQLSGAQMNEGGSENTFDSLYDIDPDIGYIGNDIQIIGDKIFLRAERAGKSDGRIYTITYEATDCAGNKTTVSKTVTVPHDMR